MITIITKQARDLKRGDTIVEEDAFTLVSSRIIAEPIATSEGIQIVAEYEDDDTEGLPITPVAYTLPADQEVEVRA